jgi:ketosteroid isomerase-like protein
MLMDLPQEGNQHSIQPVAVPGKLEITWKAQVESLNQTDGAAAGTFFTEDCFLMVGPKRFHGREDLVRRWLSVYLKVVADVRVIPLHFAELGDVILEQGVYSYQAGETRRGVYSQTWTRLQDGSWKIRSMLASGISGYQ